MSAYAELIKAREQMIRTKNTTKRDLSEGTASIPIPSSTERQRQIEKILVFLEMILLSSSEAFKYMSS